MAEMGSGNSRQHMMFGRFIAKAAFVVQRCTLDLGSAAVASLQKERVEKLEQS